MRRVRAGLGVIAFAAFAAACDFSFAGDPRASPTFKLDLE